MRIQSRNCREKLIESIEMELVWEDLRDDWYPSGALSVFEVSGMQTFKEVFLRQYIPTLHNLL